jgi:hypothetical protein
MKMQGGMIIHKELLLFFECEVWQVAGCMLQVAGGRLQVSVEVKSGCSGEGRLFRVLGFEFRVTGSGKIFCGCCDGNYPR